MKLHSRLLAAMALFLFTGLALAVPESRRHLADVWNGFDNGDDNESTKREAEDLRVVRERLQRCREIKDLLIDQLVDEQVDLERVTDEFITLNEFNPKTAAYVEKHFPGCSTREKTARQVMSYVHYELGSDPARLKITLERLELQLREMNRP